MTTRIGINGFGRIGRQTLKAILERHPDDLEVVAVNDLADDETNAHLFKYDSTYGRFDGDVRAGENEIVPIEALLYRGNAALERARVLRDELRRRGSADPESLHELYDLLDLARAD